MEKLGLDDRAVAVELGINPAHVRRLRADQWTTIKRSELQALMCWGKKHGEEILVAEPSPLWRTFPDADVVLLRGQDQGSNPLASDAQVEATLVHELTAEGCRVQTKAASALTSDDVMELMRTTNCIFIGSPKHNVASEYALAALWNVKPNDLSEPNRAKAPIYFAWGNGTPSASAFGGRRDSERAGLYIASLGRQGHRVHHCLPVDWRSPREYARWTGRGRDAGVFVVCNRPFDTTNDVTSIVFAGYSGFATLEMAIDFVRDGLRIETDEVTPGRPVMRVLSARYKKTSTRGDSRERIAKGRRWIGTPWSQLANLRHSK
jgi:hypothetical protein